MKLEDGDAHLNMWYHLLRYLWLAEMYQFSLKTRKAKVLNLSKMVGEGAVKFNMVEKVFSHLTTYMYILPHFLGGGSTSFYLIRAAKKGKIGMR